MRSNNQTLVLLGLLALCGGLPARASAEEGATVRGGVTAHDGKAVEEATVRLSANGAAGAYAPGAVGFDPATMLVPANPVNEVVGVRIPSYASVNLTYRFGGKPAR
jgi:hypothetical protein